MNTFNWRKYVVAFIFTTAIVVTALLISAWINSKRVDELRNIQDSISINLLSSDMQFNLLKDAACEDLFNSAIGQELGNLSDRLSYMESIGKGNDPSVMTLKRYYSLLEIRDYLLINSAASKCPKRPITVLYFYTASCSDCDRQSQVLTYLRQRHPDILRVYSFDHDLDVSAVKTLSNIFKIGEPFPGVVIKGKALTGFHTIEEIQKLLPELMATSTASTSVSTSGIRK
ncbi:MAG: hypothetical protein WCG02_02580 [Candidatus Taylorbacteria bacterium]